MICRTCGLRSCEHTGGLCAICGDNVEHHDQPRPDGTAPRLFADCLAGRVRMASARAAAGKPLNATDTAVLSHAQREVAS